jgi:hypothetical protein
MMDVTLPSAWDRHKTKMNSLEAYRDARKATKPKIKSVKGLHLNDLVMYEGNIYKVTQFPTRSMVCATLVHEIVGSAVQSFKLPRRELSTDFMDTVEIFI